MKLYTKNNCPACEKVKDYLKTRNISIDIVNVNDLPPEEMISTIEYVKRYSQTFPTLIARDHFVTVSDNIINYLKTLPDDNN